MEPKILEILTSLGGGAAVTTVAWTLLYHLWKRYVATLNDRITEIIRRADHCERDRDALRQEIREMHVQLHDIATSQLRQVSKSLDANTSALTKFMAGTKRDDAT